MIKVLANNGVLDNTLVIFLSDNGIHVPFAKANGYLSSVKTPFVLYWQGRTVAGTFSDSLISTIDLVPTILEAVGLDIPANLPGKSILALVADPTKLHHKQVFATLNGVKGEHFEIRSIIDQETIYIYNRFAHKGYKYYGGNYSGGLSLKGMERAAKEDPAIKARLDFFYDRVPEEIYDVRQDPAALDNLLGAGVSHEKLKAFRATMLDFMKSINDPYLVDFEAWLEDHDAR
jgi:N-sulfoglucosamine sulfohydrolase